jgi:hypothetical protein
VSAVDVAAVDDAFFARVESEAPKKEGDEFFKEEDKVCTIIPTPVSPLLLLLALLHVMPSYLAKPACIPTCSS